MIITVFASGVRDHACWYVTTHVGKTLAVPGFHNSERDVVTSVQLSVEYVTIMRAMYIIA